MNMRNILVVIKRNEIANSKRPALSHTNTAGPVASPGPALTGAWVSTPDRGIQCCQNWQRQFNIFLRPNVNKFSASTIVFLLWCLDSLVAKIKLFWHDVFHAFLDIEPEAGDHRDPKEWPQGSSHLSVDGHQISRRSLLRAPQEEMGTRGHSWATVHDTSLQQSDISKQLSWMRPLAAAGQPCWPFPDVFSALCKLGTASPGEGQTQSDCCFVFWPFGVLRKCTIVNKNRIHFPLEWQGLLVMSGCQCPEGIYM